MLHGVVIFLEFFATKAFPEMGKILYKISYYKVVLQEKLSILLQDTVIRKKEYLITRY